MCSQFPSHKLCRLQTTVRQKPHCDASSWSFGLFYEMEHLFCGRQEAGRGGLLTGICSKIHRLCLSWGREGCRQQGLHSYVCLKGTANNTYKGLKNFNQQRIWGTDNEWFFYHLPMNVSIPLSQLQMWNQARTVAVKVPATRLSTLCEMCMWWACYHLPLSILAGCSLNC